jgi:hypothetical protein
VWRNNATKYVKNGLEKCSSHAIRHSVVKWAARCDAKENDIIEAGRWVGNSQHFHLYWKDGVGRRAEQAALCMPDPIYTIWFWTPPVAQDSDDGWS